MTNLPPSLKSLTTWIDSFLVDLENANRSPHTCRAYKGDLQEFARFNTNSQSAFTIDNIRAFLSTLATLKTATRARK